MPSSPMRYMWSAMLSGPSTRPIHPVRLVRFRFPTTSKKSSRLEAGMSAELAAGLLE